MLCSHHGMCYERQLVLSLLSLLSLLSSSSSSPLAIPHLGLGADVLGQMEALAEILQKLITGAVWEE